MLLQKLLYLATSEAERVDKCKFLYERGRVFARVASKNFARVRSKNKNFARVRSDFCRVQRVQKSRRTSAKFLFLRRTSAKFLRVTRAKMWPSECKNLHLLASKRQLQAGQKLCSKCKKA